MTSALTGFEPLPVRLRRAAHPPPGGIFPVRQTHESATTSRGNPDLHGRPAAALRMPLSAFVGRWHG